VVIRRRPNPCETSGSALIRTAAYDCEQRRWLPRYDSEWIRLAGLPVLRPSRTASDLLWDHEDPEAVAQIIADSIRRAFDYPCTFAAPLAPHAARFGFRRGDGLSLLRWLLSLVSESDTEKWIDEATQSVEQSERRIPAGARQ